MRYLSRDSAGMRVHSCSGLLVNMIAWRCRGGGCTNLVEVEGGLPELAGNLVEVSHTDLSEVTRMVFIHVGSVVVLSTSETTSTRICRQCNQPCVRGGGCVYRSGRVGSSSSVFLQHHPGRRVEQLPSMRCRSISNPPSATAARDPELACRRRRARVCVCGGLSVERTLAVLADTTVTGTDVTAVLSRLGESGLT